MFEEKATKFYVNHILQNWSSEPFIQGSYFQSSASVKKVAASVEGKIYFAGEAMNSKGVTISEEMFKSKL